MVNTEHQKPTILIVEDELSVCDALKLILESYGYRVTTAINGGKGIQHALRNRFGLMIVDLHLPDMTGLEMIDAARSRGVECRFILITAYNTPEILDEARCRGASEIMSKPFSPSDILRVVAEASTRV